MWDFLQDWAQIIENESAGEIDVSLFPPGSLVSANNVLDAVQTDVAQAALTRLQQSDAPASLQIFGLPCLFAADEQSARAAWQGFTTHFAGSIDDVKVLGVHIANTQQLLTKSPIDDLDDLVGMKIRASGPYVTNALNDLGAAPVLLPLPEVYAALQVGVIDGVSIGLDSRPFLLGFHDIASNVLLFPDGKGLQSTLFGFAVNEDFYNGLPANLQLVIDQNSGEDFSAAAGKILEDLADQQATALLGAPAVNVQTLSGDWLDDWKDALTPVINAALNDLDGPGFDANAVYQSLAAQQTGNQLPSAQDDPFFVDLNMAFDMDLPSGLLRNDSDPDLDPLTVTGFDYSGPGSLEVNANGTFNYVPAQDFVGTDTFTYTIEDGEGGSADGTATISVGQLPFKLQVFDSNALPLGDNVAQPGNVIAFLPDTFSPAQASALLDELGPIQLFCRPSGSNDPFQPFFTFTGDSNAVAIDPDLVGMQIIGRAQGGAVFQTNGIDVLPHPGDEPIGDQSFGGPLVMPNPQSPGELLVDTNTVDDIAGFGSPPRFCVEVRYSDNSLALPRFTIDVNWLADVGPNGAVFLLEALNQDIQKEFKKIAGPFDSLFFDGFRGEEGSPESYSYISFRFVKKYRDGDGNSKIIKTTDFQEIVVTGPNNTAEVDQNFRTVDFVDTFPEPDDPASIIGTGGNGADTLFGSSNTNLLNAGPGNDLLLSNGASDTLFGMQGDDDAVAGPGFTFFDGGADTDTFHLDGNYFDFLILHGSTEIGFFNTHILDTRPGSPLSKNVIRDVERVGFRDGEMNMDTGVFRPFNGFAPDGTPVSSSTSHTGLVVDGMIFTDFEAVPPPPLQLQQLEFFGQAALTESQNGVLEFSGSTYVIEPPFNAYLDLRENEGRIEVFVTDADYYNFAPPGTVDQSFSITITNALGSTTYDFPFFIGRPDVAPVTDLGLSAVTVTENADAGTVIGAAQLTFVDDPDVEEDFLLQLSGADAALFEFDDAGNLVVADGAGIDFETQQAANIIISATNLNGEVFEKAFEITVENMPISDITMVSGGTVREGAADDTVVATFESSENPVEPTAVLSIVSGADGLFYLDGNELKVAPNAGSVFDFDDQSNYFITFSATDGTGPAYEESFDIFVQKAGPILGTPDEDVLNGTSLDDEIQALESDDIINASFGDDDIDGGPGTDTVVYARGRNQITHDWMNDGTIVVSRTALGEGTDTLTNVERIDLDDGSLLYDVDTPNLGFGYRIYQASFDRTPDEGGVLFWIGVLDNLDNQGWSQYDKEQFLASQFIQSDEFKALFGENPTNEQYIDAMYQNVLDRLPDQGGYDFWVGGMVNDGLTREDILIAFTKSDENVDRTAPDLDDGVWVV